MSKRIQTSLDGASLGAAIPIVSTVIIPSCISYLCAKGVNKITAGKVGKKIQNDAFETALYTGAFGLVFTFPLYTPFIIPAAGCGAVLGFACPDTTKKIERCLYQTN